VARSADRPLPLPPEHGPAKPHPRTATVRAVRGGPATRRAGIGGQGRWRFGRRQGKADPPPSAAPPPPLPDSKTAEAKPDPALAPPGFHVYRPSSADHPTANGSTPPEDDDF
jgi:hypothetical protein